MATFSFYGNKILTSGEGGAITLDDLDLERRVRLFRGQGMDPERRYFFPVVGYNYRLTNVACALLCAQLERMDAIVSRRRAVFQRYREQLAGIEGIGFQPVADWASPAHWMFSITVDEDAFGMSRDRLARVLADGAIETRPFFHPIHRLPPYEGRPEADCPLPVTDRLASTGMNLPTSSVLSDEDIRAVTSAIWAAGLREAR
jgi:perosamine synthetase